MDLLLDYDRLAETSKALKNQYTEAAPFPHIVIDGFLGAEISQLALSEFPEPNTIEKWRNRSAKFGSGAYAQHKKFGCSDILLIPPVLRQLIWELNSKPFLDILTELTGVANLITDPTLQGGGLHITEPEGLLAIHADFRKHRIYGFERRLNLLIYFNDNWKDEYGGHLELWDRPMKRCEKVVAPLLDRCVIFSTSEDSFHGHPHPLTCPQDRNRKSLAIYYYTNELLAPVEKAGYKTEWRELPDTQ